MSVLSNTSFYLPSRVSGHQGRRDKCGGLSVGTFVRGLVVLSCCTGIQLYAQQASDSDLPDFGDYQVISDQVDKPTSIDVVDIDRDGDYDILAASTRDSTVRLFLNIGTDAEVEFTEHVLSSTEDGANSVRAADIDGDGDLDAVVAARLKDAVVWFEQLEVNSGSFGGAQDVGTQLDGVSFAEPGDMDGDGDADVVAAGYGADQLVWYENLGSGSFAAASVIDAARDGPWMVHLQDHEPDGDLDIAVAFYSGDEIARYVNDGNGVFDEGETMASDLDGASYITGVDINQDGYEDLAFTSYRDDRFGWFENTRGGDFSAAKFIDATLDGPASVHAVDLDRDQDMDVVVASLRDDRIVAFENQSDGLGGATEISAGEVDGPRTVHAGDFNEDGNPDLVVGGSKDNTVGWFENLYEPSTVPTEAPTNVSVTPYAESLRISWDFVPASADGGSPITRYVATATPQDGGPAGRCLADAAQNSCHIRNLVANVQYSAVVWAENAVGAGPSSDPPVDGTPLARMDSAFELSSEMTVWEQAEGVTSVYAADVDGDFDLDLLVASLGSRTLSWYENFGDDTFSDRRFLSDDDRVKTPYSVSAADLDGDGNLDVLATTRTGSSSVNGVAWIRGYGDGSFSGARTLIGDVPGAISAVAIDMDGDDDMDVVFASYDDDYIAWAENDGSGRFGYQQTIATGVDGVWDIDVADLDGDGRLDVMSASIKDDTVAWYLNEGGGEFTRYVLSSTSDSAASVQAADLDGDGDLDVIAASYRDDTIAWFENLEDLGGITFSEGVAITTSADGVASIYAGDIDFDGDMDIFSASIKDDTVAWYENEGGSFDEKHVLSDSADGARAVHLADLDDDGDLEVVAGTYYSNTISWWKNLAAVAPYEAPMNVRVEVGIESLTVSWDDISRVGQKVKEYVVQIFPTGSPDDVRTCRVRPPETMCEFLDLQADVEYSVTVWAENQYGAGPKSVYVNATPIVNPVPPTVPTKAPANVSASPYAESLRIDWDSLPLSANGGSPITRYLATAVPANGGPDGQCVADAAENSCYILNLTANVQYSVVAWAENKVGAGPMSDPPVDGTPLPRESLRLSDEKSIWTQSESVTAVYAADMDNDSDLDVLVASLGVRTLSWYRYEEDDGFGERRFLSEHDKVPTPYSVSAADLDNDGNQDVITTTRTTQPVVEGVIWCRGGDTVWFETCETKVWDVTGANDVVPFDMDGDGDQDLVFAAYDGDYIGWSENNGSALFGGQRTIGTGVDGAYDVDVADLTGDGRPDVVSASVNDDTIAWYRQEKTGRFTRHVLSSTSDGASSVEIADLDLDGDLDIVAASSLDDTIVWFENLGDSAFSEGIVITTSADGVASIYAGDIDFDGDVDIFSASVDDDTIAWYENEGGAFGEKHVVSDSADGASAVHLADLDDDGDLDVVAGTNVSNTISWWENLAENIPYEAPINVRVEVAIESLTVSWDDISRVGQKVQEYVVQIFPTGSPDHVRTCRVLPPATMCQFLDLQADVEYSVTVWAENQYGAGPKSAVVVATPYPIPPEGLSIVGEISFKSTYILDEDTADPNNAEDDNDSFADAQMLEIPGHVGGWLSDAEDRNDYYKIEVEYQTPVTIKLFTGDYTSCQSGQGGPIARCAWADFDLYLYNSDEGLWSQSATPNTFAYEHEVEEIQINQQEVGTYYIRANISNASRGNYLLSVEETSGDTPAAAASPPLGFSLSDEFLPDQAIIKIKHSDATAPGAVIDSLVAEGLLKVIAGEPERELLVEFAYEDTLVGNEWELNGRLERFQSAELARKARTIHRIKELSVREHVEYVLPNLWFHPQTTPNDPRYGEQWHYELINLADAWRVTTGNDDVVVAVVDTGYIDHPDLVDRLLRREDDSIAGFDMVLHDDGRIDDDAFDDAYEAHGIHVMGIIGAKTNNSTGMAGVTWATRIMPVRVLTAGGSLYDLRQGIRYAAGLPNDSGEIPASPASIINLGVGADVGSQCGSILRDPSHDALAQELDREGVLMVWSAGNSGCRNSLEETQFEGSIVVSATNALGELADYSNYGDAITVAAPGGASPRSDHQSYEAGNRILSLSSAAPREFDYGYASGTSMSAAHVSGVVALMMGANANLTMHDVLHLFHGTHPEYSHGPITQDIGKPGWDRLFGYGLLDAEKAVQAASSIRGGLEQVREPRLRLSRRTVVVNSLYARARIDYGKQTEDGEPIEITEVVPSVDWIDASFTGDESSGTIYLTVDREKADRHFASGGSMVADVTVHIDGGRPQSLTVLFQQAENMNGDAGMVYVQAFPEDTNNPTLYMEVDTTAGESSYRFENVANDLYLVVITTDRDDDLGDEIPEDNCEGGELCGVWPDYYDQKLLILTEQETTADVWLYGVSWIRSGPP